MTAMLLATFFTAAALLALGVLVGTWRSHGAAMLDLRRQIAACTRARDFRYTLVTVDVRPCPQAKRPVRRAVTRPALRAA